MSAMSAGWAVGAIFLVITCSLIGTRNVNQWVVLNGALLTLLGGGLIRLYWTVHAWDGHIEVGELEDGYLIFCGALAWSGLVLAATGTRDSRLTLLNGVDEASRVRRGLIRVINFGRRILCPCDHCWLTIVVAMTGSAIGVLLAR